MGTKEINSALILMLCISMSFYLAKLTPYSPVYVIYIMALPVLLLYILASSMRFAVRVDDVVLIALIADISVFNFVNAATGEFINLLIGVVSYLYIHSCREIFGLNYWLKTTKVIARSSILLMGVDTIYRLINPTMPSVEALAAVANDETLWFYPYKFGTMMFADSNTTGLISMIVAFMFLGAQIVSRQKLFKWELLCLLILVAASLSRSAIVATSIGLMYATFRHGNKHIRTITTSAILVVIVVASPFLYEKLFASQGSLESKFQIMRMSYAYLQSASMSDILFGVGLGGSIGLFGIHTHLIYLTYLIEAGALALALFLIFLVLYIRRYGLIILLPVMIASMSYFLYLGAPFLFVPLAVYSNIIYQTKK